MHGMTVIEAMVVGIALGGATVFLLFLALLALMALRRRRPIPPPAETISEATRREWLQHRRL